MNILYRRALTPLFGNRTGPMELGKLAATKIGKFDIVFMDISIARLIPIIKLALVYYEKRKRKK